SYAGVHHASAVGSAVDGWPMVFAARQRKKGHSSSWLDLSGHFIVHAHPAWPHLLHGASVSNAVCRRSRSLSALGRPSSWAELVEARVPRSATDYRRHLRALCLFSHPHGRPIHRLFEIHASRST